MTVPCSSHSEFSFGDAGFCRNFILRNHRRVLESSRKALDLGAGKIESFFYKLNLRLELLKVLLKPTYCNEKCPALAQSFKTWNIGSILPSASPSFARPIPEEFFGTSSLLAAMAQPALLCTEQLVQSSVILFWASSPLTPCRLFLKIQASDVVDAAGSACVCFEKSKSYLSGQNKVN